MKSRTKFADDPKRNKSEPFLIKIRDEMAYKIQCR